MAESLNCPGNVLPKKPKKPSFTEKEIKSLLGVFNGYVAENPGCTTESAVSFTCDAIGVCRASVFNVLKENKENQGVLSSPKKSPGRPKLEVDDFCKNAIRRIVHSFFHKNEPPSLQKVLKEMEENPEIPNMGKTTLWKVLKEMNFRFKKRNRQSLLIERNEIVVWRRKYLRAIKNFRREGRRIYYLDETWVNAGHTVSKAWVDQNIKTARQAAIEGLSMGLKNPTGKGKRLIIAHVGSENGFIENSLLVFESKKNSVDYHDEMNGAVFEEWFQNILQKMEPNSVIVMDNASYHSRKKEKIPNSSTRKGEMQEWLSKYDINYDDGMCKAELLDLVKLSNIKATYVIDEMANDNGHEVLRLPPYHCELNPIELIWAQIKNEVARKNTTFKFADVQVLFKEAVQHVTMENWTKAIEHVKGVEEKMWELDHLIDRQLDPILIQLGDDSSSDDDSFDED